MTEKLTINCVICKEQFQYGDMIAFWQQRPTNICWYAPWQYWWVRRFAHNTCWRASNRAAGYDVTGFLVAELVEKFSEDVIRP